MATGGTALGRRYIQGYIPHPTPPSTMIKVFATASRACLPRRRSCWRFCDCNKPVLAKTLLLSVGVGRHPRKQKR